MACSHPRVAQRVCAAKASSRCAWRCAACLAIAALAGCGGGGGGGSPEAPSPAEPRLALATSPPAILQVTPAPNVLPIELGRGPRGTAFNTPFVSVTVCLPGTASCQTIDKVLLDTGSSGLRLAAAALESRVELPSLTTEEGAPVAQCLQFASGVTWGSVRRAEVRIAGERTQAVSVQVYDEPPTPARPRPTSCGVGNDLSQVLDANGILGVGPQRQDCGAACERAAPPAIYFACSGGMCTTTSVPRANQVGNPIAALPTNNNGLAILLPAVPAGGASLVTGAAILGIGTQPNNPLGPARVFAPDADGFLSTTYNGATHRAFLDTGTNSVRFPDAGLPLCGSFYCPPQPGRLMATITSAEGVSTDIDLAFEAPARVNADAIAAHIAGGGRLTHYVNWGLPFFFGRVVHVAIEGAQTPAGPGPYWAF